MTSFLETALPHDIDAERALLGGILLRNELLYQALDRLEAVDLYLHSHQLVYTSMRRLATAGRPIDLVLIAGELKDREALEEAGGPAAISSLIDGVARIDDATHYIDRIVSKSLLRRAIRAAHDIHAQAFAPAAAGVEVVAAMQAAALQLSGTASHESLRSLGAILDVSIALFEGAKGGVSGVPTGIPWLDDHTGGWQKQDLIIVAARPSVGKTSYALNVARFAVSHGFRVLIFSAEMSAMQIGNRLMADVGDINGARFLRPSRLGQNEWNRIAAARVWAEDIEGRLLIDDRSSPTPTRIYGTAREAEARMGGLDLVIVDYLQLCDPGVKTNSLTEDVTKVSNGLKSVAKRLDVPLIALSQLTRAPETQSRRPHLSDLRQSGAIEQDADVVAFLHRPKEESPEYVELLLAKQRNGPLGVTALEFQGAHCRFRPWEIDDEATVAQGGLYR